MRRLSRLGRPINVLRDPPAPSTINPRYCSVCRSRRIPPLPRATASFSTLPSRPARRQSSADSGKTPFTERLRQKLWGTESPPGQVDPYNKHDRRTRTGGDEVPVAAAEGTEAYSPATTWDGLEHVGGFSGWWEKNWDPEHGFKASMCFIPPERLTSPQALTNALHRAVVEVFTLQQAGRPMGDVSNISSSASGDITTGVQITVDGQGVSLAYPDDGIKDEILQSAIASEIAVEEPEAMAEVSGVDAGAAESIDSAAAEEGPSAVEKEVLLAAGEEPSPTEEPATAESAQSTPNDDQLQQAISSWNPTWLSIPLTNPGFKFAVLKRTIQLTGCLLPDPQIHALTTTSSLLNHLVTPPPPKKLAEVLGEDDTLVDLPNVRVFDRRVTPVDREKAVGRWKVIEKELEERGLPVLGRG
ncbi:MAG: hypothetical protein M1813_009325 [Trichoglossum hirsutum]|nr:MAG: hypothetical protein M1813_009325 [Trichoglossum hirsutum]